MSYLSGSISIDKSMSQSKILVTQEASLWRINQQPDMPKENAASEPNHLNCLLNIVIENEVKWSVGQHWGSYLKCLLNDEMFIEWSLASSITCGNGHLE